MSHSLNTRTPRYNIETPVGARFSFIFYTVNTIADSGVHSWRSEHLSNINEALDLSVPKERVGIPPIPRAERRLRIKTTAKTLRRFLPEMFDRYVALKELEEERRKIYLSKKRKKGGWDKCETDISDFDDDEWELRIVGKGVTRYDEEQAKYIWGKITAFNYDSYMYRVRYDDGVLDTILLKDIRGYLVTECAKCGRSTNNNEHVMLCDGARCFNEYHMRCLELDSVRSNL